MSKAGRPKAKKQRCITFDVSTAAGTAEVLEHFSVEGQFNWKLRFWNDVISVNSKHEFIAQEIIELQAAARRLRTAIAAKDWIAAERADGWANITYERMRQVYMAPLAQHGKKFPPGRKVGSFSPIHKAIARVHKLSPNPQLLRPRAVWKVLTKKPPRGYAFKGSSRQDWYIEGPKANMTYGRFSNICKVERDKLKPKITV